MSAIYSGKVAARKISELSPSDNSHDFSSYIAEQENLLLKRFESKSRFSAVYIRNEIAKLMNDCLGITRTEEKLSEGIQSMDYYISISDKLIYDSDVSPYVGYSIRSILLLARAILTSALARRETRGSHIRQDYPERSEKYECCSICVYRNNEHIISYEKEE